MYPRRFFGFAWNVGDPMNFKVIQCNNDPYKHNYVVHRGLFVPLNSAVIAYNYAPAPKGDSYIREVHLEGVPPRKPVATEHQGNLDYP